MRVLVGCECSGRVREAFRRRGHDAHSCDTQAAEDGSPYHYREDVRNVVRAEPWDLFIFHAPCTFTANSGAKHLYIGGRRENGPDPERWANMRAGVAFFLDCWSAPVAKVCAEWPIIHEHAQALLGIRPTQIIQPFHFGTGETKATVLRLRGLRRLVPTHVRPGDLFKPAMPEERHPRVWLEGPSPDRQRNRSRTDPNIAEAFAAQWG